MEVKGTLAGLFFKICLKREDLASRPGRLWVECEVQADDTRQMSTGDFVSIFTQGPGILQGLLLLDQLWARELEGLVVLFYLTLLTNFVFVSVCQHCSSSLADCLKLLK